MNETGQIPRFDYLLLSDPEQIHAVMPGSDPVAIYEIDMSVLLSLSSSYASLLPESERAKAAGKFHEEDRLFTLCSYGIRRVLLSRYTGISPEEISFGEDPYGKPFIRNRNSYLISFNVSHSKDRFLMGICRNRDIGVDIQQIDPGIPVMKIARRFFQPVDYGYLASLPGDELISEFYRIWTMKEACIKAVGKGFSFPAEQIPRMSSNPFIMDGRSWYWQLLPARDAYQACVIVSDPGEIQGPGDSPAIFL
ncbi:MAG: 4'-phosphopantetheinyl transferase superfamily protein [Methanospirillum sp.]|nr:4'-phosphopantetheinyl transferase superfamily protein [Methanospirillum sp.]